MSIKSLSLLLPLLQLSTTVFSIGVNYGTLGNNLRPPAEVVNFLKMKTTIDRVKIFDTNPDILRAFANSNIAVIVTLGNGEIPAMVDPNLARAWVTNHIVPFHPQTKFAYIAVGNEIIHSNDQELISKLVPAMRSLHDALLALGIKDVKVSTPHSMAILVASDPPSIGRFNPAYETVFKSMFQYHRETKSPFMVNPYPYFGWSPAKNEYALFKNNPGVHDKATGITYTNMFDATMDACYTAMKTLGYGDVDMIVTEIGWPHNCEGYTPCTIDNAATFNNRLIAHVTSGKGTPLMPNRNFETYIFALFNENLKPGPAGERNWGLFNPDFTPVYNVPMIMRDGQSQPQPGQAQPGQPQPHQPRAGKKRGRTQQGNLHPQPGQQPGNPQKGGHHPPGAGHHKQPIPHTPSGVTSGAGEKWCVPKPEASDAALQKNIDYACGNGVDCKPIQPGGACFTPNAVRDHARYAMNAYYALTGRNDQTCDFTQTGLITTNNPSYAQCQYS